MPANLIPSNADTRTFKVAAVQAEPVWLDLEGSVNKTISIINEAAANGAKVNSFNAPIRPQPDISHRSLASPKSLSQGIHGHRGRRTLQLQLPFSRHTKPIPYPFTRPRCNASRTQSRRPESKLCSVSLSGMPAPCTSPK